MGRAGIALPSAEMQRAEGPVQGHQTDPKALDLMPTLSSIICSFIHSPNIRAHIFVSGNEFALGNTILIAHVLK